MEKMNQYFLLLELEIEMVMDYLFLLNNSIVTKATDENKSYFINQKILIDYLLENHIPDPETSSNKLTSLAIRQR